MKYTLLPKVDPQIHQLIIQEQQRQREQLQMIPSENYASKAVLEPLSSVLSNKYSEGYPGARYYQGNQIIDQIERLAIERAKKLFGVEYVNIQPFSGSPANIAVYLAVLSPGAKILAMDLSAGGHLSHGSPVNISSKLYQTSFYQVDPDTLQLDYDQIRNVAQTERPDLILAGASAYPRIIDFQRFREIADEVGALLMADIAHIAGLVVGGLHPSPVGVADVITTTTHKTLRGPRGAIIMAKPHLGKKIDKMVFPGGIQAGPHNHVHAAKAVCFHEAMQPEFKQYTQTVVENAQALAENLNQHGFNLVTSGTDNHLILIDLRSKNIDGKTAAIALEKAGIIVNYNLIPYDPNPPQEPSGIRLGTPAITSRGLKPENMEVIGDWIDRAISNSTDEKVLNGIRDEVKNFARQFPVPGVDD